MSKIYNIVATYFKLSEKDVQDKVLGIVEKAVNYYKKLDNDPSIRTFGGDIHETHKKRLESEMVKSRQEIQKIVPDEKERYKIIEQALLAVLDEADFESLRPFSTYSLLAGDHFSLVQHMPELTRKIRKVKGIPNPEIKKADYPKHPDTVVIGPSGGLTKKDKVEGHQPKNFTERDVWSYYEGIKSDILKDIKGKDLFIRLKTDTGFIYVRHPFGGNSEYIRIGNDKDFDKYNNGRTVEFHTTMPAMCPFYVVDFDAVGDWNKTKKIAGEIADGLEKLPGGAVSIRYTGKRGFHILKKIKPVPVDKARETLKEWLKTTFGDRDDLVVGESPSGSKGALGVSPMKLNGGQVALWSLRVTGLCCVEVPRAGLMSFNREDASMKKVYKKLTGKTFIPVEEKKAADRVITGYLQKI